MEALLHDEGEKFRFVADEYASKVMSATYGRALSIQEISEICDIPLAVAYRRVKRMVDLGLLACVKERKVYRGKIERYYLCAVEELRYTFNKGTFSYHMSPAIYPNDLG